MAGPTSDENFPNIGSSDDEQDITFNDENRTSNQEDAEAKQEQPSAVELVATGNSNIDRELETPVSDSMASDSMLGRTN